MGTSSRSEAVGRALEPGFPLRFECILDHCLKAAIKDRRDAERATFVAVRFLWNVHPAHRAGSPGLKGGQKVHQFPSRGWRLHQHLVHTGRVLACVDLRNPPHAHENVGVVTQHELLERANLAKVVRPCRLENTLSQAGDGLSSLPPIDEIPDGPPLGSVCAALALHLTCPSVGNLHNALKVIHQVHVSGLSAWATSALSAGLWIPLAFRLAAFAS